VRELDVGEEGAGVRDGGVVHQVEDDAPDVAAVVALGADLDVPGDGAAVAGLVVLGAGRGHLRPWK
jgi:hypothetical protein